MTEPRGGAAPLAAVPESSPLGRPRPTSAGPWTALDFQVLWTSLALEILLLEDDATLIPAISAAEAGRRSARPG